MSGAIGSTSISVAREAVGQLAEDGLAAAPAACSSRAAVLTASPVTSRWPRLASPAITSPLLTPMWFWSSIPQRASEVFVEGGQGGLHRGRAAHRPERVVLVADRQPEDRHDRVADELLDGPAVAPRAATRIASK